MFGGYILPKVMPNYCLRIFVFEAKKLPRITVHLGSSTECVTPIESLTCVPRMLLGPCLTRLVDVPFPRNTQNSKVINCVISMLSSYFWIKLASEKTHMQPQEYDKKTSFGPWTILSVYLPLNGQKLLKTQQTQGLGTLTHSSEASTSIEILVISLVCLAKDEKNLYKSM